MLFDVAGHRAFRWAGAAVLIFSTLLARTVFADLATRFPSDWRCSSVLPPTRSAAEDPGGRCARKTDWIRSA